MASISSEMLAIEMVGRFHNLNDCIIIIEVENEKNTSCIQTGGLRKF